MTSAFNRTPILQSDDFTLEEGDPFSLERLLANDHDPEGDILRIDHFRDIDHGSVALENGHLLFKPEAGYHGDVTFSYWVRDHAASYPVMGRAVLHYLDKNLGPVAGEDRFLIMEDSPLITTTARLLANDREPDGENLLFDGVGEARHGSVSVQSNGTVTFVPDSNYSGKEAGFSYRVRDESGHVSTGFAAVEVLDRRDPPVVGSTTHKAINEDELLVFTPEEVAKFVTDPDGDPVHLETITNISGGTIITRNGWYTFQPDPEYSGRAGFDYTAGDNRGGHVSGHLEFVIEPVNDPIETGQDHLATTEDSEVSVRVADLLANDTDVDGSLVEFIGLEEAEHGTATVNGGTVRFIPDPDYSGNEAFFTYKVRDDRGLESTGKVMIDVRGTNDAPRVTSNQLSLVEDREITLTPQLLSTCITDVDGDHLSVTDARALSGGTVITRGSDFVFIPDPDYHGSGSLQVSVTDGTETLTTTLVLDIQALDDPATCGTDLLNTLEEQAVTVTVTEIMANDTDIDGPLSFAGLGEIFHGRISVNGETLTFTPDTDYFGDEAGFTYLVRDPDNNLSEGRVTVQVENVDDTPKIVANRLRILEDTPVTFTAAETAKFIHDPDPDPLLLTTISNIQGGRVEYDNGVYTFIPDQDFYGPASFDYVAKNRGGEELSGHLDIAVSPVNDLPHTTLRTINGTEDHESTIDLATLLNGADDVEDGGNLRFGGIDSSVNGDVYLDDNDILHFLPDRDFFGTASFRYTVLDSEGGLANGYVTVDVSGENDAPLAKNDRGIFAWSNNRYENIYSSQTFLANDVDVDHDTLRIVEVRDVEHGSLSLDTAGNIHYTAPSDEWVGIDSFTYVIDDGHGGRSEARAEIDVKINTSPDLLSEMLFTREDTILLIDQAQLLANDTDIDHDHLRIISVNEARHGTVSLLPDGSIRFVPELNYNNNYPAQASFRYTVSDGISDPVSCIAFFDIDPVNDNPILRSERINGALEDNSFSFTVAQLMANDIDVEMASPHETDSISFVGIGGAAHGRITVDSGGTVNYVPNPDFFGIDTFSYTITDANGGRSTIQSQIYVQPVNDLPLVEYDRSSGAEDTIWNRFSINRLLANDSDVDGDTLSVRNPYIVSGHGQVRLSGSSLMIRPDSGQHSMVIGYTVSDGHGGEVESRLSLDNIREHNYAPTFSGLYAVTRYNPLSGIIFSFHAEDRNGGDNWTITGGQHQMGDLASITVANLRTDYPLAHMNDYGYGHFGLSWQIVRPGGGAGDDWDPAQLGYNATFTLTATDRHGATGTIFVDLARMQKGVGPHYHYSPVVLDLDGDGVELLDISQGVEFDWNRDGIQEATGWAGRDDGFLVYDYDHGRLVTKADELALREFKPGAATDLAGLQTFDSNNNGLLDTQDENWHDFGVWQDKNSNGITDEGEFSTLDELEITSISLESDHEYKEVNDNTVYGTTTFTKEDGTTGEVADVGLNGTELETSEENPAALETVEVTGAEDETGLSESPSTTFSLEQDHDMEPGAATTPAESSVNHTPAEQPVIDDTTLNQLASQLISDMAAGNQTVETQGIPAFVPPPADPVIATEHHDPAIIHDQDHDLLAVI